MKEFRVTKREVIISYAYIKADNWEEAEDKAHFDDNIEWETNDHYYPDYDVEEVEE